MIKTYYEREYQNLVALCEKFIPDRDSWKNGCLANMPTWARPLYRGPEPFYGYLGGNPSNYSVSKLI